MDIAKLPFDTDAMLAGLRLWVDIESPTFDAARGFVTKLGKQIAVAEDFPAFIVNLMLMPMINAVAASTA